MKINEFDKQVSQADIDELEKFADKIFAKVGIDVNFTRHFLDRVNDERNGKPISMSELTRLFKQEQKRWGKKIAQLGPDEEAVMKDLQTDLNLPFALRWDDKNNELDLIAKTVMRKKNFRTPNPEFPVEGSVDPVDMAAAAGVSGVAGSLAGRSVGNAVVRDLKGDGPEDRRRIKSIKQDRQKKLTKTPSVRGNANTATKPTSAPMTAKLPGVTRGGAGAGGAAINPKRIGGGGRVEPKLRSTPFNMFNESGLPPHLAKHFDKDGDAVKGSWKDGEWTADKKQPKKVKYTVKDVTPKGYGPLEEDFGSVPPLPELIIMAVAAKTSVDILKGMFKTAIATGKGLKKLNNLRKKAASIGQGVADYAMPESLDEATKDELMSMMRSRQEKAFYDAALTALDRLVKSKGSKQSVGGYAFDIARAFAGIDAKELVNMYNQINEWGLARKQRVAKQSDPLTVLDTLSTRNDDAEFPIKFYDDEIIKVTPTQARRFMNAYLKMEPEKRDIIDKYIKSKKGFKQAIQTLDIREDAFDLLSAALDWDK